MIRPAALLLGGAAAPRYRHGAVLAVEANAVTHRIARDYEVQDGLGVVYVRVGHARVARLVSTRPAARLFPDLAPLGAPDGVITAGDGWLVRQIAAPVERMLLSSARRFLYEVVPARAYFARDHLHSILVETDERGQPLGRRAYAPFGAGLGSSGETETASRTGGGRHGNAPLSISRAGSDHRPLVYTRSAVRPHRDAQLRPARRVDDFLRLREQPRCHGVRSDGIGGW